jgi:hypothetical protein
MKELQLVVLVVLAAAAVMDNKLSWSNHQKHLFRGIIIVLKKSFYPKMTRCFGSLFILKIHIFNCQF